MPQAIPALTAILGIAGAGSNIFGGIQKAESANLALDQQKRLAALAKDPTKLAAAIKALQQPLSHGLVSDVTNATQGQLSERGLSESPAIFGAQLSENLAPYEMKEQDLVQNALFQSLGLPPSASGAPGGAVDTSSFWSRFLPQGSGTADTSGITMPAPNWPDYFPPPTDVPAQPGAGD